MQSGVGLDNWWVFTSAYPTVRGGALWRPAANDGTFPTLSSPASIPIPSPAGRPRRAPHGLATKTRPSMGPKSRDCQHAALGMGIRSFCCTPSWPSLQTVRSYSSVYPGTQVVQIAFNWHCSGPFSTTQRHAIPRNPTYYYHSSCHGLATILV